MEIGIKKKLRYVLRNILVKKCSILVIIGKGRIGMLEDYREIVKLLKNQKKTIATMESCTGGGVVNCITDIEGASEVLRFSAVTYSNEAKVKMGVDKEVIDQYTVYSQEVADQMSYVISQFADSDYGVGITGMLNCIDPANSQPGKRNMVYLSIYDRENNCFYRNCIQVHQFVREKNKETVIQEVGKMLLSIL